MSRNYSAVPEHPQPGPDLTEAGPQLRGRLLRRPEVEDRTGLARSTIYQWISRGDFPAPVKLGARMVAWRESDIEAWLEERELKTSG